MWDLPITVKNGNKEIAIRNKCDFRVVLDVIRALKDDNLTDEQKTYCALFIFFEDITQIEDYDAAIKEMMRIINGGEEQDETDANKPILMDWEHDFPQLAPPISRVLGYDVRMPEKFTHWYSFLGGYMEIGGDCTFSTIVSIRSKRAKNQKLDKWEQDYIREHRKMVELPQKLTAEEQRYLDSDW